MKTGDADRALPALPMGNENVRSAVCMKMDLADAEAVRRTLAGEQNAFSVLVLRYIGPAHSVAYGVLGDELDAEDVVQDAFLIAFQRLSECRQPARFRSWLLRIVRNRAYNVADYRRLRRHEELSDVGAPLATEPDPATAAANRELREALTAALQRLRRVECEVLLLHDLEHLTHAEIATILGTSELMCRKHLMNARRRLREGLAGHREEP
jgi:RNA polymerase sigma-70 factor (ECF subfamily)